jgi:hypothetical protein
MANKRTPANELMRLLQRAAEPIYALDEELTIIFLNQACMDWLGTASEELIGTRAAYHSPAEAGSPEGIAAGLCPPPEVLAGNICTAVVACHLISPLPLVSTNSPLPKGEGIWKHRRAKFIPLGSPDNLHGILAILETVDCPTEFAENEGTLALEASREELRATIRRFRREAAGRYSADHLAGVSPARVHRRPGGKRPAAVGRGRSLRLRRRARRGRF